MKLWLSILLFAGIVLALILLWNGFRADTSAMVDQPVESDVGRHPNEDGPRHDEEEHVPLHDEDGAFAM
jgi:hypothetical protein